MASFKRYNAFTFKRQRVKPGTYQLINLIFRSGSTTRFLEQMMKLYNTFTIILSESPPFVDFVIGWSSGLIKPITGVAKNLEISNLKPRSFLQILCRVVLNFKYLNAENKNSTNV